MAGLLKGMALPSEVLDLFEKFEFEVCLLLRLLSQQPERRPSAQHMRDELFKSLPNDGDGDKGQEVEKLRKELAELKKQNHIKEQQERMQGHSKVQCSPASYPCDAGVRVKCALHLRHWCAGGLRVLFCAHAGFRKQVGSVW